MPEGDTVYRAAHRLHAALAGKTLSRSDFRIPSLATTDLRGAVVERVRAVGKHLFIDLSGAGGRTLSIHSHLMMEGVWHVYRRGEKWRKPGFRARVVLAADGRDGAAVEAVGFDLGILEITRDPAAAVAHLGPDLLGPDWDPARAAAQLAADPERPVGLALLDQRTLAGIGNIYRSELCFLAGVHPTRPVREADPAALVADAHRLLTANALAAVRSTTGDRRRGRELWVYGREHRPCRRCGTAVQRGVLGVGTDGSAAERSIYFCPACQPVTPGSGRAPRRT
ncbi:DNA glycosylase [Gordonia alkaliphila]|uniref:DNA-(apurinic or apyrimidinic site) lyase n=1 Tax=Gordonia alkaliphila TaxID=1053547 RepID=A0ABP8Z787_9ACTN|nr:DNA-formamidopyrimidine glycosylase family protein [Gordonia alkaliphila]MCK0440038.1 DNA glycosylase [Gordonia alkaliphila]